MDPPEFHQALEVAHRMASRFVSGLPSGMDLEAFSGEARLAVAMAARTYQQGIGSFVGYAAEKVYWALRIERRRQDPASEWRRAKIRRGEVEEQPSDRLPLSFEALRENLPEALTAWDQDTTPGPEARFLAREEVLEVWEALEALNGRQRQVLLLRYWGEQSRALIASRFGVSEPRIRQIERQALRKLKRELTSREGAP